MSDSDDGLLAAAKAGDRDALGMLLRKYGPSIRRGLEIQQKWRSILDVDDVMQVTYFEAFEHIGRLRSGVGGFRGWLRRIAANNLRDAIESLECIKRPQPENQMTAPAGGDVVAWLCEFLSDDGTTPSGKMTAKETRAILEREIETLPEIYRRVLELMYFEERSVAEASKELGRTRGAVHLLRIRALDRLRARFGDAVLSAANHG